MLFYRKVNENIQLCTGLIVHHRTLSAVNGLVFDRNRVSYIFLGDHWCNVIVLNVHASSEGKSDDSEDRIYEGSEQIFYDISNNIRKFY